MALGFLMAQEGSPLQKTEGSVVTGRGRKGLRLGGSWRGGCGVGSLQGADPGGDCDHDPLVQTCFANTLPQFLGSLFTFLMLLFAAEEFLIWMQSSLSNVSLVAFDFWCHF